MIILKTITEILSISFDALSVSCGVWDYNSLSDLVYVPQLSWDEPGTVKFIEGSTILSMYLFLWRL
jgi:hypothetical protein